MGTKQSGVGERWTDHCVEKLTDQRVFLAGHYAWAEGLGPILLKLRLLAARLGSQPLGEWVKHESEGYPLGSPLPGYRTMSVSYTATFSGPFGAGIKNAPIPPYLIEKVAGENWNRHEMRQSIAAVDDLLAHSKKGGEFGINASNLILLLSGNIYEGYACNAVSGKISRSALAEIRHAVRSRILELTIELERTVPEAASITVGEAGGGPQINAALATQVSQQIIYGNVTSVSATGDGAQVHVSIGKGDAYSGHRDQRDRSIVIAAIGAS